MRLFLHSKDTIWIKCVPFPLSDCPLRCFKFSQGPSHCSGLAATQVQGLVLLLPVQFPQVLSLVLADDCQYTGYGLSHHLAEHTQGKKIISMYVCVYNIIPNDEGGCY